MIVKDLSNSFSPCPKVKIEKKKEEKVAKNFCIMPKNNSYSTVRTGIHCERHEAYFGKGYRDKSIEDGLIVFLKREDHRGTNGVHGKNGDKLNRKIKKIAQKTWIEYYGKTEQEFIARYGKLNKNERKER